MHAAVAQAEGQIVVHAHVLIERVVLEHHGDVAVFRLQAVHDPVADGDGAAADVLQPGHHAQGGRLAAARRSDQHDELVVGDVQVEILHGGDATRRRSCCTLRESDFGHAQTFKPSDDVLLAEDGDDQRRPERQAPRSRS